MNTTSPAAAHDPDGVPHEIVGVTLLLTVAIAASLMVALFTGRLTTCTALVFVPGIVILVDRRARLRRR